jgi:hypothetical protein
MCAQKPNRSCFSKIVTSAIILMSAACSPAGPPIKVNAGDLAGAYLSNAPAAEARFHGHPLIVTGVSGGVDASNTLTLIPGVLAEILGDASSIGFGSSVTVRCDTASADENAVHLKRCTVEDVHVITLDEVAAHTQEMLNQSLSEQRAQPY